MRRLITAATPLQSGQAQGQMPAGRASAITSTRKPMYSTQRIGLSARELPEVGAQRYHNQVCGCVSRKKITRFVGDAHMSNDSKYPAARHLDIAMTCVLDTPCWQMPTASRSSSATNF